MNARRLNTAVFLALGLLAAAASGAAPPRDFTIVMLPDTQNYAKLFPATLQAQADWIIANRTNLNIVYVGHLGDLTDGGDTQPAEWGPVTNALYRLLDPARTGTPDGIPLGVVPGNHDHLGGIARYNEFFGTNVFARRSWYGGHLGADNRNHYDLFAASGLEFIAVYTDFDFGNLDYGAIDAWANGVLAAHAKRRAIVITHCLLRVDGTYDTNRNPDLYRSVGTNDNVFLMLCGHNHGEVLRTETNRNGRVVHLALSDYQSGPNGGDGFLRLYQFSPAHNVIHVRTYSPTLDQYQTDADSEFDLPYEMGGADHAPGRAAPAP